MSGVKIRIRTFRTPADIAAPGALDGVIDQATLFADTLYLEREGLPGNLSALAQRIIALAPLAASNARSAAELMACIGNINRLLAVWPALKSAEASRHHGTIGGSRAKRQRWAEAAAERLASERHATEDDAWRALPDAAEPWEFETDEADIEVYADGDDLIAVNSATRKEQRPLKKSTFLKNYYRSARIAGK